MTVGSALLEVFLSFRTQPAAFDAVLVRGDTPVGLPARVPVGAWSLEGDGQAAADVSFGPFRTSIEFDGVRLRADGTELSTERFGDTAKIPANWVHVHKLRLMVTDG